MFHGTLFKSQVPAAEFLVNRKKVLLGWEQGCGKTIISTAATEKLFELGKASTALVVAQPSIIWQWADKLDEFTDSQYVLAEAGNRVSRSYEPIPQGYNLVGYNLFRNDFSSILKHHYDIVIMDEAQEFRSTKSKTRKLVLQLNRDMNPTYRWALTGTAIANALEELYSLMYWVDKDFLPPWPVFEKRHIKRNHHKQIQGYKNIKSLNKLLPYRFSRKEMKDMGRDYPTLVEQIVTVKKSKEYEKAEKELLKELDTMAELMVIDGKGNVQGSRHRGTVAKAFTKAKKSLAGEDKLREAVSIIKRVLAENGSNKLICFSFYKQPITLLQHSLGDASIDSQRFTGSESSDEKRAAIHEVEKGDSRVLLASNAGYKGLDLPSFNFVLHLDVPPSWEILDQRNKRARRITSVHGTTVVIYLVFEYSLELYYLNLVKQKGLLAEAAYHGTRDSIVMKPESLRQFLMRDDRAREKYTKVQR